MIKNDKALYVAFFLVFVFFIVMAIDIRYLTNKDDVGYYGNLGQYLSGTIGTVISLLALFGLFIAYISQKKQLKVQQEEINDNKIFYKTQILENNFYELMNIWLQLKSQVIVDRSIVRLGGLNKKEEVLRHDIKKGDIAFEIILDEMLEEISQKINFNESLQITTFRTFYSEIYREYQNSLTPYYRIIYQIFKLIYNEREVIEDTKRYSDIIRSQMGNYELLLFFFHGISIEAEGGVTKNFTFKEFVVKYNFFEFLDLDYIKEKKFLLLLNEYTQSAYDESKYFEIWKS